MGWSKEGERALSLQVRRTGFVTAGWGGGGGAGVVTAGWGKMGGQALSL